MSDLRTRVINGDFKSKLPYPSKSDFDRFYVYNKGQVIENGVRFDDADTRATKTAEWKRLGYTVEIVNDTDGLRATRNAYNDDVPYFVDVEGKQHLVAVLRQTKVRAGCHRGQGRLGVEDIDVLAGDEDHGVS